MSYRLQLLLRSFGKLGQIQAASSLKKKKNRSNYFLVLDGKTQDYKTDTYLFLIHQRYALGENKNTIALLSKSKSFRVKLQHSNVF